MEEGRREMKKLMVLLVAFVLLIFAINSYALDFRGLRLGMTEEEVCKWLNINANPLRTVSELQEMVGNQLRGQGVVQSNVVIEEKVEEIAISIFQDESEAYKEALHNKYGKPFSSKKIPYVNNFGVRLTGIEEYWKIKNEHLWFIIIPKSVGDYSTLIIFQTNERFNKRHEKKTKPKL